MYERTFSLYVTQKSTQPVVVTINEYSLFFPAVKNGIVYIRVWKAFTRLLYLDERCEINEEGAKFTNNTKIQHLRTTTEISPWIDQ